MLQSLIDTVSKILVGFETTGETPVHVNGLVDWFKQISDMLLANDIVLFILALGVISAVIALVMSIVSYFKHKKKR